MQPASSYLIYLLFPVVFGLALAGFGAIFLITVMRARQASQAAQAWITSAGRVISAKMNRSTVFSHDGPRVSYEPVIEYEYSVMGVQYQGRRIAFGADTLNHRQAQQVLDHYRPDAQVTVYYDPNRPAESVLERSAKGAGVFTAVGLIFTIIGTGICCVGAGIILLLLTAGQ